MDFIYNLLKTDAFLLAILVGLVILIILYILRGHIYGKSGI